MKSRKSCLLVLALCTCLSACGSKDAAASDAGRTDTGQQGTGQNDAGRSCRRLWNVTVGEGQTASAEVTAGTLILRGTGASSDDVIHLSQSGVVGDFDAVFTFSDFVAAETGAFVQAVVHRIGDRSAKVVAGIGTAPTTGVGVAFPSGGATEITSTAETSGTLRLSRSGDSLTAQATAGGVNATAVGDFPGNLVIGLQLGSSVSGAGGGETSIVVSDFSIDAGGDTISADSFDCNSLILAD